MKCPLWSESFLSCYFLTYWSNDKLGYTACDGDTDKCPTVKMVMEANK